MGACPEAGLGVASEGPKPGDGSSATENPCPLQSVLVSLVSVLQTGSCKQGHFRFPCSWSPAWAEGPQACLEEGCGLGWRLQ